MVADAKYENIGWHVYHISFVPSMQVPGMQVHIAVRNNTLDTTTYLDLIKSGTSYVAEFKTPDHAFDYDLIAVCSIGDITVQFPLFHVESDDGSHYTRKDLWKA